MFGLLPVVIPFQLSFAFLSFVQLSFVDSHCWVNTLNKRQEECRKTVRWRAWHCGPTEAKCARESAEDWWTTNLANLTFGKYDYVVGMRRRCFHVSHVCLTKRFLRDAQLWCAQKGQNENSVSVVRLVLPAKPVHSPQTNTLQPLSVYMFIWGRVLQEKEN